MGISIHTALPGSDWHDPDKWELFKISIHTALAGCDANKRLHRQGQQEFQSTQPSQAVTEDDGTISSEFTYFNPHSPRRL